MTDPDGQTDQFSSPITPQNLANRQSTGDGQGSSLPSHTPTAVYPPSETPFITARIADARRELERKRSEELTNEAANIPLPEEEGSEEVNTSKPRQIGLHKHDRQHHSVTRSCRWRTYWRMDNKQRSAGMGISSSNSA